MKKAISLLFAFLFIFTHAKALEFYSHGDREQPRIAITVDDCYDKQIMQGFLELAKKYDAKLTFFVIGRTLHGDDDEALYYQLLRDGHEIGNHSNNHKDMRDWDARRIAEELKAFQTRLDKVLGFRYQPNLLRFPYGKGSVAPGLANYNKGAEQAGYAHIIHWDVVLDSKEKMLERIQKGSIVLLHANKQDLQVLGELLEELSRRYTLVTVSDLLGLPAVEFDLE